MLVSASSSMKLVIGLHLVDSSMPSRHNHFVFGMAVFHVESRITVDLGFVLPELRGPFQSVICPIGEILGCHPNP
jgi:hypothetical protein